ncbi:hypothetical protein VNO80_09636 [Phaseolus coccineus]|uniref:Phototropic-responsive NPH3 family protein n=1 Tax=Phaseolus coccineus TaxID=3886 RepID=A0AAN9N761_PHACN
MRGWNQSGAIQTIYEEEHRSSSTPSLSPSPSFSSSPPSLHSIVNAWSLHSAAEPNVLILVQGTSFRLHQDCMISQSSYLKQHLVGVSNVTISPPLNITAETFSMVADFCYTHEVHLTPSNVAAIRVAAELLGMTEGENLCEVTESYFERVVAVDASMVMRSCVTMLPEAETTASLVSRCIEALIWNGDVSFLDDVVEMHSQDFQIVASYLNKRLPDHDALYKIIDIYLKENKYGKLTEEQQTEICNNLDCSKLSPHILVECVQNPRMSLKFIMGAILVEHLKTRDSLVAAATTATHQTERTSLRKILQHAHRHTTLIEETMDSTYHRIQNLEKELMEMKNHLQHHQFMDEKRNNNALNQERSVSFHFEPPKNSRIQRGGRGSISSSSFMLDNIITKKHNEVEMSVTNKTSIDMTRFFPRNFMFSLKNAFGCRMQRQSRRS